MRGWIIAGMIATAINIWAVPAAYALGRKHGRRRRQHGA